jgi:SAM-dependent methyltransferase
MKQNTYDDPKFFAFYSSLPRSKEGLNQAEEWAALRMLLPNLRGKRLLDLGCGLGWHCRYARQQGASFVVGVDLSERMLAHARSLTTDPGIDYRRCGIEDIEFAPGEFDTIFSSLALHYVRDFDLVCRKVCEFLNDNGAFVFAVEHPIVTAVESSEWCSGPKGEPLHWPLDRYAEEGPRQTTWVVNGVIKYHRTISSYINTVIDSGFRIEKLAEPAPSPEMLLKWPHLRFEQRRPSLLLIAASRHSTR